LFLKHLKRVVITIRKNVLRKGTITYEVYELFEDKKKMSIEEVRSSIQANYNTVRSALIRLTNLGLVERVGRGEYKYKPQ